MSAAILVAVLFAGWRVVGQMQAERHVEAQPEIALRWRPHDPRALLALAERQFAQGNSLIAQRTARELLAHEPIQGEAFRLLAAVADQQGRPVEAAKLYRIASRLAPRDMQANAWLTQHLLERGDYAQALEQIDRILRMSPKRSASIAPVLAELAQQPDFAKALAKVVRTNPPWRSAVLEALRPSNAGSQIAERRVMEALQSSGDLSSDEYARWLDSLMAQGRWGEAYARWAGSIEKPNGRLSLVYNGDFRQTPSDAGFDWRRRRIPGVLLTFEPVSGTDGMAAYLRFLDRRIPEAGLEQLLMLLPGRYRLSARMRAQDLRSADGLQWQISCDGPGRVVARSEGIDGSFGWREDAFDFAIPEEGCPGQRLRLVNPIPGGGVQRVSGELWLDDVVIQSRS